MWTLETASLALAAVLGAVTLRDHWTLSRAMRPRPLPPRLARYPSISVIRPIKGRDPELAENVRSGLEHGYPGEVESLFVFDDEHEYGIAIVEEVIAEYREAGNSDRIEILICGPPPPDRTGKLNAMLLGVRRARGELIAFADSDIRTDRDALRILVETMFHSKGVGCTFAPAVVSERARSLGDAVCAMLLNGLYTPAAARETLSSDSELPFVLGQLMLFTRPVLDAIGGLESLRGQLVDDLYIGVLVRRAGYRNVASTHPIRIIQYGLSPREALSRYTRWLTFSRTGIPQWSFKRPIALRAILFWVGFGAMLGFALSVQWLSAAAFAALATGVAASVNALHNRTGCAPLRARHWIASAVLILLAPLLLARVHLLQRRVEWRGRVYELDANSRLAG